MVSQRSNTGGLVGGAILIGLGLLFLAGQFFNFSAWAYIWPLVVIGVGAVFFVAMLAGGKSAAPLAIPGSIISVIGLMLLLQNLTGHWESWAYGWTVIVAAVGLGLFISGTWSGNAVQRQSGLRVAGIGVVMFVLFGAFFELVLFGFGGSGVRQIAFPVLLIVLGLALVLRRAGFWPAFLHTAPPAPAAPEPAQRPPEQL